MAPVELVMPQLEMPQVSAKLKKVLAGGASTSATDNFREPVAVAPTVAPTTPTNKSSLSPTATKPETATAEFADHNEDDLEKKAFKVEEILDDALTNAGEIPTPEEKVTKTELLDVLTTTPKSGLSLFVKVEPVFDVLTKIEAILDWSDPRATLAALLGYLAVCYYINIWVAAVHIPFGIFIGALANGYFDALPSARIAEKNKSPRGLSHYLSLRTPTSIMIIRFLKLIKPLDELADIFKALFLWQHPPSSRLALRTALVLYVLWMATFPILYHFPRIIAAIVGIAVFFWNAPPVYLLRVRLTTLPAYHEGVKALTKAWLWWARDIGFQRSGSEAIKATRENYYGFAPSEPLNSRRNSIKEKAMDAWERTTSKFDSLRRGSSSSDEEEDKTNDGLTAPLTAEKAHQRSSTTASTTSIRTVTSVEDLAPAPRVLVKEHTFMIRENQRWYPTGWSAKLLKDVDPAPWTDMDNNPQSPITEFKFPELPLEVEAELLMKDNTIVDAPETHKKRLAWKWLEPNWKLADMDDNDIHFDVCNTSSDTLPTNENLVKAAPGPEDGWDYGDHHWNALDDDSSDNASSIKSTAHSLIASKSGSDVGSPKISRRRAIALKLADPILGIKKRATRTRIWIRRAGLMVVYVNDGELANC